MLTLKVITGIILNVVAQLSIKQAAAYPFLSLKWILVMSAAAFLYLISFIIYSFILKESALNIMSPLMAIGTMILIVIISSILFIEPLTIKQLIGLVLGIFSLILLAN